MTGLLVLSVVAAGTACSLLVASPAPRIGSRATAVVRSTWRRLALFGLLAAVVVAGSAGFAGRHLALLLVVGAAGLAVLRAVERSRVERRAQQRRQQVVDYCEALAGELRAGQPVSRSVERSVEVWPDAEAVVAAVRLGASVPESLRRLSSLPGAATVRRLAGAWEISASTGAGLVVAVEQVLATARSEEATARLVRAELASARATARLVTALPVVVLAAAQGVGAQPWHFLLDTTAGVACLGAGATLSFAGLAWIDRIAVASVSGAG